MTFLKRGHHVTILVLLLLVSLVCLSIVLPANKKLDGGTILADGTTETEADNSTTKSSSSKNDTSMLMIGDIFIPGYDKPHPELCPSEGADLKLVITIPSSPGHVEARDAVRSTWGHYATRSDIALAFFLGSIPQDLIETIAEENFLYRDLVIGRFIDSYSNLTLKTLSMLTWFNAYCSKAPRLLKADDDVFINLPNLLEYLGSQTDANKTIWGRVMTNHTPHRETTSKYYVPPEEYPYDVFPDYTSGPAYIMTADSVEPLLELAPTLPYLRLEDVFVTGVLGNRLGITKVHDDRFYFGKVPPGPCVVDKGFSIYLKEYKEQFDLWYRLKRKNISCVFT